MKKQNINRQDLLKKVLDSGYALNGVQFDQHIKDYNNFEMKLSERLVILNKSETEYQQFIKYINKQI
jgi:hypothetical protein